MGNCQFFSLKVAQPQPSVTAIEKAIEVENKCDYR